MSKKKSQGPRVGIIMGSAKTDMETMIKSGEALNRLGLIDGTDYEWGNKSVHRTPDRAEEYARTAKERGVEIIIAGAGGSAHLPGMVASMSKLPVLGVAVTSNPDVLNRALGSMIGMPEGKPLATFQGESGAFNAGLFAARILSLHDPELADAYEVYEASLVSGVIGVDEDLATKGGHVFYDQLLADKAAKEFAQKTYQG